jgi:SAM-dependent methyltransferase
MTDKPHHAAEPGVATRVLKGIVGTLLRTSALGFRKETRLSRYRMYRRLREVFADLPRSGRILALSRSDGLCRMIGLDDGDMTVTSYPEVDMLDLPYEDERFDFVVSDFVIEHVQGSPQAAIDECRRVLRPGGHMVHTTRLLYPLHGPSDLWGFTPLGLSHLCGEFSKVVESGGWGNGPALVLHWLRLHRLRIPEARWHPLHWIAVADNPRCPIVTWVVAEK